MNQAELLQALRELLTSEQLAAILRDADPRARITVREALTIYLRDGDDDLDERTRIQRVRSLNIFMADLGDVAVADCTAIVVRRWLKSHSSWASPCTGAGHIASIRRAFNWLLERRLIREFPFPGLKMRIGESPRRGMPDAAYRILARHSHAAFRRFITFLRATGCRPSEAASLRWSNIDWRKSVAVLTKHKTAKKTGVARTIFLTSTCMKLLRWIEANPRRTSTAAWLTNLLRDGPRRLKEVATCARAAGVTPRMLWKAKQSIGATFRRVASWGGTGYIVYELPAAPAASAPEADPHVFTTTVGKPWTRNAWCLAVQRARKKSGSKIPCAYTLRHRLATELCRIGVNLKIVAVLMGHRSIQTTMRYTHGIDEDVPLLQQVLGRVPK